MLIPILEELINRAVALDPDAPARLREFSGRVVAITLAGTGLTVNLAVHDAGVYFPGTPEGTPDARLTGTPVALLRMFMASDPSRSLFAGEVTIQGDRDLAHALKRILRDLEIDWEEALSQRIGDVAAHQAGNLLRRAGGWARGASRSLRQDLEEFLLEEIRLLPRREEVLDFVAGVDRLRDGVERLEKRLQRVVAGQGDQPA